MMVWSNCFMVTVCWLVLPFAVAAVVFVAAVVAVTLLVVAVMVVVAVAVALATVTVVVVAVVAVGQRSGCFARVCGASLLRKRLRRARVMWSLQGVQLLQLDRHVPFPQPNWNQGSVALQHIHVHMLARSKNVPKQVPSKATEARRTCISLLYNTLRFDFLRLPVVDMLLHCCRDAPLLFAHTMCMSWPCQPICYEVVFA